MMAKRIVLFLITNALVVLVVSLILDFVLPLFGINPSSQMGALIVMCAVFGFSGAFISLLISRWVAKVMHGVRIIDEESGETEQQLQAMVADLAHAARITVPQVGIYSSPDANAFATGPSKRRSLVAFSSRLLEIMDEEQLQAVAAHEISHIASGDMVTTTLLTGIANTFVMFFARIVTFALDNVLGEDGRGGLGMIAHWIVVMLLQSVFMLLASIPLAWFSRRREFRADARAARIVGPHAMAEALARLQEGSFAQRADAFSMAKISSTRRTALFATHPPIQERIRRLVGAEVG